MSSQSPAAEATKNTIENTVNWYLQEKLQDPATTIATQKYLTNDNTLVHLTHCNVAEIAVPRIKVQVFKRMNGGVEESVYQIFADHRMTKYLNTMIFGTKPGPHPHQADQETTEQEATELIALLNSLQQARQTL